MRRPGAARRFVVREASCSQRARQYAGAGFRILDIARRFAQEMLQSVAAFALKKTSAIRIGIDVQHGLALEFGGMLLGPFGRPQQTRLLAVPTGVDQCAARLPALPDQ